MLLVDDQNLLRQGMRLLLEFEEDISVVGEAADGQEAIDLYAALRPDIVLMDVEMPGMNGIDATRHICAQDPQARIIILTTFIDENYIFEGFRAGARSYLLKAVDSTRLIEAVHTTFQHGSWVDAVVARKLLTEFARTPYPASPDDGSNPLPEPLNERELEILRLLTQGSRNRDIAVQLHLAEGTVKNNISSLMKKLQAKDRTHAVARAKELKLL